MKLRRLLQPHPSPCRGESSLRRWRGAINHVVRWLVATGGLGIGACDVAIGTRDISPLEIQFNQAIQSPPIQFAEAAYLHEASIVDAIPGKAGHHAATITAFSDGGLTAAWYSYDGPGELDGAAIYSACLRPNEAKWTTPVRIVRREESVGNPVLFSEGERVLLFFAVVPFGWSTAHIEMQLSPDRGATWEPAAALPGPIGSNVRYAPIRLKDGRLLLPAYDDLLLRSLFLISDDGRNWQLQSVIETSTESRPIQPSIAALDDGSLLAVMRNTAKGWMWVAASGNAGRTWTRPEDSGFPNPGSAVALSRLADGHLILVFNDSPNVRRPLSVALSADNGRTWPFCRVLADGDESYSYPSVAQSPDGLIHVVYSLARRSIRHAVFNEAWIAE